MNAASRSPSRANRDTGIFSSLLLVCSLMCIMLLYGCSSEDAAGRGSIHVLLVTIDDPGNDMGYLCVTSSESRIVTVSEFEHGTDGMLGESLDGLVDLLERWRQGTGAHYRVYRVAVNPDKSPEFGRILAILDDLSECGPSDGNLATENSSEMWDCRLRTLFEGARRWYTTDMRLLLKGLVESTGYIEEWDEVIDHFTTGDPLVMIKSGPPIIISESSNYAYTGELIRCIVQRLELGSR